MGKLHGKGLRFSREEWKWKETGCNVRQEPEESGGWEISWLAGRRERFGLRKGSSCLWMYDEGGIKWEEGLLRYFLYNTYPHPVTLSALEVS